MFGCQEKKNFLLLKRYLVVMKTRWGKKANIYIFCLDDIWTFSFWLKSSWLAAEKTKRKGTFFFFRLTFAWLLGKQWGKKKHSFMLRFCVVFVHSSFGYFFWLLIHTLPFLMLFMSKFKGFSPSGASKCVYNVSTSSDVNFLKILNKLENIPK